MHLSLGQTARTARAITFGEPGQPLLIEPPDPVLDGPRGITEHSADFGGGHSLSDEQEPVEAVVVPRLIGATNFILEGEDHVLGIRDG
jgi:hypothetical protein